MTLPHSVLIVGVGSIGERHLRCFQSTGRAEVSFVEVNPSLRATIAERYGVRGFADLDEALEDQRAGRVTPQAMWPSRSAAQRIGVESPSNSLSAVVATPANRHLEIATQLAEAGMHLLIEKPLSTGTDDVERLERAVRERGVVVSVAYVLRCFPALAAMREALLSGRFGKPVEIIAVCGQNFPTYRPAYRDTYYTDHATGGGAIQDALTHSLPAQKR